MTEEQAKQLLEKYVSGNASLAEKALVEKWYIQIEKQDLQVSAKAKAAIGASMLNKLKIAMQAEETVVIRKRFFQTGLFKIAATFLVLITVGLGIWKLSGEQKPNYITVTTGINERKKLKLSDGSEIILEPSAQFRYPGHFAKDTRQVSLLKGEAFFEISHDVKRPFTVITASGPAVKVLGTSFRIRNSFKTRRMEVVVATGKVEVVHHQKILGTLIKDQQLDFDTKTGSAAISKAKHKNIVPIDFEGATLQHVIAQLGYLFTVKVNVKDADLNQLKCTANFNSGQEPEEILDIICTLHHIRFKTLQPGKIFEIYK
ncbi:FecR family protein [Pedobacter sp. AW1-32]|uniref:FecR family protein n=1 Tax=Pedobacter sp. AW1-32 TaxID=3383026 RepID=UPI003FEED161